MQANVDKLRTCLRAEGPRECAGKHLYDSHGLAQGLYSVFLPEWLDYFNQEEMLVSLLTIVAHALSGIVRESMKDSATAPTRENGTFVSL